MTGVQTCALPISVLGSLYSCITALGSVAPMYVVVIMRSTALRNEEANKTTLDPAIEELLNLAVVTTIARLKTTALLAVLQEQLPPTKIK